MTFIRLNKAHTTALERGRLVWAFAYLGYVL